MTDLGRDGVAVRAPDSEQTAEDLQLSLLGIPLRRAQVDVVPRLELVPSGHAIGVLMGRGVLVTQVTSVIGPGGRVGYPARDAGLQPGDVIVEVAGEIISHGAQLESLTQEYGSLGKPMPIVVERVVARSISTSCRIPPAMEKRFAICWAYGCGTALQVLAHSHFGIPQRGVTALWGIALPMVQRVKPAGRRLVAL